MNNFRNPYVDPDTYQGKVHDYYKNPTTPNSIHFSLNKHQGFEQKETRQSQKYEKTKKHSIYLSDQLGKITDSKPVLFSPPKVDSVHEPLNENSKEGLPLVISESKNREKDKEEVVSTLAKEFSLMLDDTFSKNEGFTTLPESEFENDSFLNSSESTSIPENKLSDEFINSTDYKDVTENNIYTKQGNTRSLFDEFHSMLDEPNNLFYEENIESLYKNNGILEDIFSTMLSESDGLQEEKQTDESQEEMRYMNEEDVETYNDTTEEKLLNLFLEIDELQEEEQDGTTNEADLKTLDENTDMLEDKFFNILLESDELQEEKQGSKIIKADLKTLDEETDTMEDKFFTILSESAELQKEKQDSLFANLKETKSGEIEELSKDELPLCHKKPSIEKKKKYYINKNNPYQIACFKGIEDERFFKKNTHFIGMKKTTTVKVPVLLTRLKTDIDIVETIDLLMPLYNILKVEWSVQSLDCKVVLPSKTVFLKGVFIAEIVFSNKELENKTQTLKITIPWKKTENIQWLSVPEIPYSNQKEFMFQSQHEHDANYHYETYQKFEEPIQSQLKKIHFVWHQELNSTEKQLQVNGVAQLFIHFMQEQFVELDCYSK